MLMAYSRQSVRTWHSAQIDLAASSRIAFSSLRSGVFGGKNNSAYGPLQAASRCQSSTISNMATPQWTEVSSVRSP